MIGPGVLASGNPGKLRELAALLDDLGWHLRRSPTSACTEVAETGTTFVENAIIKARHAAEQHRPAGAGRRFRHRGRRARRRAGRLQRALCRRNATDADNNALLVEKLREVPPAERGARYRAVIVYMRHAGDPSPLICEGSWEGHDPARSRPANGGFGYDPYFYLPELGCTSAELTPTEKNRRSHRGQALAELKRRLEAARCLKPRRHSVSTSTCRGANASAPYCDFNSHAADGYARASPTSTRC